MTINFFLSGLGGCEEFCSCDLCFAGNLKTSNFDLLPKETRAAFNNSSSRLKTPSHLCSSVIKYNDTLKIDPSKMDSVKLAQLVNNYHKLANNYHKLVINYRKVRLAKMTKSEWMSEFKPIFFTIEAQLYANPWIRVHTGSVGRCSCLTNFA